MTTFPSWLPALSFLFLGFQGETPILPDPLPYFDKDTFLVAKIQPPKIAVTKLIAHLRSQGAVDFATSLFINFILSQTGKDLDRHVEEFWIAWGSNGSPEDGMAQLILIPRRDQKQLEFLKKQNISFPGSEDWRFEEGPGWIFYGNEKNLKNAKRGNNTPNPSFVLALKTWQRDYPIQFAYIPTPNHRKNLLELEAAWAGDFPGLDLSDLTQSLDWISWGLDLFPPKARLYLQQSDSKGADKAKAFLLKLFDRMPNAMAQDSDFRDLLEPTEKLTNTLKKGLKIQNEGVLMEMNDPQPLLDLLVVSLKKNQEMAKYKETRDNMARIFQAITDWEKEKEKGEGFAPAIALKDGKPGLSWRVLILPHLGEEKLFKEFRLEEPWDSPHNQPLVKKIPAVYRNPNFRAPSGTTSYLLPVGTGTLFPTAGTKIRLKDIPGGPANRILLVEGAASRAVPWTKPEDWPAGDMENYEEMLFGFRTGFNFAYADGSLGRFRPPVEEKNLRALLNQKGEIPSNKKSRP